MWMETLRNLQLSTNVINSKQEDIVDFVTVDMQKRKILLSASAYSGFLTVQNDHLADQVWFITDRYFDGVDLSQLTCTIEYINAAGEGRICPVTDIDIISNPEKLKFSWHISREATKTAGKIKFLIHFYALDPTGKNFIYSLNTQPCEGTILKSLDPAPDSDIVYDYPAEVITELYGRIDALENKAVSWVDL